MTVQDGDEHRHFGTNCGHDSIHRFCRLTRKRHNPISLVGYAQKMSIGVYEWSVACSYLATVRLFVMSLSCLCVVSVVNQTGCNSTTFELPNSSFLKNDNCFSKNMIFIQKKMRKCTGKILKNLFSPLKQSSNGTGTTMSVSTSATSKHTTLFNERINIPTVAQ